MMMMMIANRKEDLLEESRKNISKSEDEMMEVELTGKDEDLGLKEIEISGLDIMNYQI